jgi:hypothetical protein
MYMFVVQKPNDIIQHKNFVRKVVSVDLLPFNLLQPSFTTIVIRDSSLVQQHHWTPRISLISYALYLYFLRGNEMDLPNFVTPSNSDKQQQQQQQQQRRRVLYRFRFRNIAMRYPQYVLVLIMIWWSTTVLNTAATTASYYPRGYKKNQEYSSSYTSAGGGTSKPSNKSSATINYPLFVRPVAEWYTTYVRPNVKHWPKIQCRMEPTTTLKIRKTFRPLKTIVRLSAHYNTQIGVWQFRSSWEDAIIGGKFTLAGRKELQFTKSWSLTGGSLGSTSSSESTNPSSSSGGGATSSSSTASTPASTNIMDDMVTRLRLRAAVDLQTWKAYVRVGFRTERFSPMINVMEGFTVVKHVPLDGANGKVKLEIKANFALPEPEIEYSTETHRSLVGMGDIEVGIEELNLLLDY